jgi:uncharacterized protein (TIGR00159 family)
MIGDLLKLFRWQDALDIFILTYIFYRLYLWLRKKKALRMVIAMLALPFFYLIARWIDLPLSVWGLQNLWPVILLVLVVIFQQEIREVLGNITLPSFFFGRSGRLASKIVDKIARAAFQMANRRMGGLIVLQKGDDLDEFIHEKTLVDSEMDEDLLLSLFHPQSPLHDGAVVIRGDRIRYAGGLLPFSKSSYLPKEWGTRHRAGVGITEVCDAECIIISEERGEVLFAWKGKVGKKAREEDLRESLSGFIPESDKKKEKKWPKKIFEDLPRKGLFLVLVCLLWVFFIGIRQGEMSFHVPIEYYSIPADLAISGEPPREINVRLKGSQRLLSLVKPDQIRAQVNLSNTRPGTNQILLSEKNMNTPSGITVAHLYPRQIRVQLSILPPPNKK